MNTQVTSIEDKLAEVDLHFDEEQPFHSVYVELMLDAGRSLVPPESESVFLKALLKEILEQRNIVLTPESIHRFRTLEWKALQAYLEHSEHAQVKVVSRENFQTYVRGLAGLGAD